MNQTFVVLTFYLYKKRVLNMILQILLLVFVFQNAIFTAEHLCIPAQELINDPNFSQESAWETQANANYGSYQADFYSKNEDKSIRYYFATQYSNNRPLLVKTNFNLSLVNTVLTQKKLGRCYDFSIIDSRTFKKDPIFEYWLASDKIAEFFKVFYDHRVCPDHIIDFFIKFNIFQDFRTNKNDLKKLNQIESEIADFEFIPDEKPIEEDFIIVPSPAEYF